MSTKQPVAIEHPFRTGETLAGERVGVRYRPHTPYPLIRVRVDESVFCVPREDVLD